MWVIKRRKLRFLSELLLFQDDVSKQWNLEQRDNTEWTRQKEGEWSLQYLFQCFAF